MNEKPDKKTQAGSYLITLLAAVLHNQVPPPIPAEIDLVHLYKMAKWHSVAGMACYGLIRLQPLPNPEIIKVFREERNKGLAREAIQEIETRQILSALKKQHIKCMLLKGYIIKNLYPQPDMRMMADVDILIEASQLKKAGEIMLALGYAAKSAGGNHDVYHKLPVMNVELHRALIPESNRELYNYFGSGWERAGLKAGSSYIYEMPPEDFYIYLLAHMAKHYRGGGTGIRSVMDLWVYNQHFKDKMDWSYINTELKKAGLSNFVQSMEALSQSWFNAEETDKFNQAISAYVLSNGTYGTIKNAAVNRFIQEKKDSDNFTLAKIKYALRILFPDIQHMTILFPFLHQLPVLLPVCWAVRGIRTVMFRPRNIILNSSNIRYLTNARVDQMKELKK